MLAAVARCAVLGRARGEKVQQCLATYLAGRAVGHAGALVAGKVEVGWTGALVAATGGEQAEVAAAAVVGLARVVEHWEAGSGRERERDESWSLVQGGRTV